MKEFLGIGGYNRTPEGYMSWQHLTFVTSLILIMGALAVFFGLRNRDKDLKAKNKALIVAAIAIDAFELFKIVVMAVRAALDVESADLIAGAIGDSLLHNLPLYLCSIQLITIPLAAFSKGRVKEAALDFVFIFGMLGAVLGTYGAGQNYGAYPVLSLDNVVSGITHTISGFASLYIIVSGMAVMNRKNIGITFSILGGFSVAALITNLITARDGSGLNYMFLMRGDGTPYDIFYNLVGGNPVIYPIVVIALFLLYISVFYLVYYLVKNKKANRSN